LELRQIFWNPGAGEHQVFRRVIRIELYQILDHGKREMLGGICDTGSWRGPPATVTVASLSIEWCRGKRLPQHCGTPSSTDAAVSNPAQDVLHLARSQLGVDDRERGYTAQGVIRSLKPVNGNFTVAEKVCRQRWHV
jgi:hypothetical protein